ncbi:MAG: LysR family transcriptional regulator [Microbacterium sp.]|uniref:LysR family transcriptional regulator n=1 Tax=Microbacterium sp. TaxID=51671 RepID=UPI0039E3F20D
MDEWMPQLAPQLRALVELARQDGHMTDAAAALGIPQSSMSRRVHALEERLGVPLVIRDGRQVRLSPAAVDLAERARGPLRELESTLAHVTDAAHPDRGTVRLGFPLTMGAGTVPDLLADFNRRYPGIRLILKQAHGAALFDDLREGTLDLAITIPAPDDLPHTVIAAQEIRAIIAADHPLAARTSIPLAALRDETFIANPPTYNLRHLTEGWCRQAGFEADIRIEITESGTIRELIRRSLGVALLPPAERPIEGVAEVSLTGPGYSRQIALAAATTAHTRVTARLHEFILTRGLAG